MGEFQFPCLTNINFLLGYLFTSNQHHNLNEQLRSYTENISSNQFQTPSSDSAMEAIFKNELFRSGISSRYSI